MASSQEFVDYVLDQIAYPGELTGKKMFGEYGLYADGKIFAVVCDDKLFIKPIPIAREYIGAVVEAPPYPGAKNYYLIEDQLDDREWMGGLISAMAPELPAPKPKKKRRKP